MKYLLIFIALLGGNVLAQKTYNNSIQRSAQSLMTQTTMKPASISFYVYDLGADSAIADLSSQKTLVPASTMKVLTTATALQVLGSYFHYKTHLQYDGYIDTLTRTLHGNIYIKGGGDPTLGSKYFDKTKSKFLTDWYEAVSALNIDTITGAIIGDASHYTDDMIPSTWTWGDMGNYYGAGPNGLTIFDNLFEADFRSGENAGDSTWVECVRPYVPRMDIENRVKAAKIKSDQAYIYGAPYDEFRLIQGRIPLAQEQFSVKGALADPAHQAAFTLNWLLRDSGLVVHKNPITVRDMKLRGIYEQVQRETFYTRKSPSLSKIVYWTNLISCNLYAEHLLREVAKKKYSDGSNYSGTIAVKKYWQRKGVNVTGLSVNDGSGLSRQNAVSAQHLVGVLKVMNKSKYAKSFKSSLPIAGKTGTLRSVGRGTAAQGNLRAKSGTMTRVKSYAGYVTSKSGRKLAFAIIVNNYTCSNRDVKKKLEKVMVAMANFNG